VQYPDEFIVQVKGTTGACATIGDVVTSLTFISNKQVYGPYGNEQGKKFESLLGGKVVGFFGQSGTLLDQFGVLYQASGTAHIQQPNLPTSAAAKGKNIITANDSSITSAGLVVEGPWGGPGGRAFHDGHGRIVELNLTYHKSQINSLQAAFEHGGVTFQGCLHGTSSGTSTKVSEEHLKTSQL